MQSYVLHEVRQQYLHTGFPKMVKREFETVNRVKFAGKNENFLKAGIGKVFGEMKNSPLCPKLRKIRHQTYNVHI